MGIIYDILRVLPDVLVSQEILYGHRWVCLYNRLHSIENIVQYGLDATADPPKGRLSFLFGGKKTLPFYNNVS